MIVDFIRHGEPMGGRCYRGHGVDDALSDLGWRQMREAVAGQVDWDFVVSSPMTRCCQFALELGDKLNIPVRIEDQFKEIGFGLWEGVTPNEVQQRWPDAYAAFYADPVNCPPEGAEPVAAFRQRVSAAYLRLIQQKEGEHGLVVAHAGVIRAVVSYALDAPLASFFRIKVPYAGVTRLQIAKHQSELVFHAAKL